MTLADDIQAIRADLRSIKRALGIDDENRDTLASIAPLTTRQHAALQMLLRGASNREIADRFGVTVNTAKVHVRGLFAKAGENTRTKLLIVLGPLFDATPPDVYMRLSGGLPKDWDTTFVTPDPYAKLYGGEDGPEAEAG